MKCYVCGANPLMAGVELFRQNAKGVTGVWACRTHRSAAVDPVVDEIVGTIASAVLLDFDSDTPLTCSRDQSGDTTCESCQ